MIRSSLAALLLFPLGFLPCAAAQDAVEVEGAYVAPASIDVAVPGDSGTRFSMTDDLSADSGITARIRYSHVFSRKHWVGVLLAPLTVDAEGVLDRGVSFNGVEFPAGTPVDASYRFDSYRVSYRYLIWSSGLNLGRPPGGRAARIGDAASLREAMLQGHPGRWQVWLGGALKVRDAAIRMEGGNLATEKDNQGVVPLLSFHARWSPAPKWSVALDGEGLVSSQGRAEDVLLAVQREIGRKFSLYAGYRFLEGGADNDEVYTFALFHGAVAGAVLRF